MELDVETIIEFLKAEKGVKLNEMMAKLGVDRGGFLSWRQLCPNGNLFQHTLPDDHSQQTPFWLEYQFPR